MLDLPPEDRQALLRFARSTLVQAVKGTPDAVLREFASGLPATSLLLQPAPCFVTLTQPSGRLRGCIGRVFNDEDPLYQAVFHLTQQAAFSDPRFSRVSAAEVEGLHIEISILGPLEPLHDPAELTIGVHGLYVRAQNTSGLLLAQVATDYGWTVDQFIQETCEKAGLSPSHWKAYEFFYFEQIAFGEPAKV